MGIQVNAQLGENNDYVHAVKRISEVTWNHMKFPWLWFKPIWYLSGYGFEFDRNVKLTNDFTRKVRNPGETSTEIDNLQVIQERKELLNETEEYGEKKRKAFLDLLLTIQKENGTLSDEDIREEVDTFMFEGHDTTASGIGFTVLWLGFNPECQKKLHKELDEVFGNSQHSEYFFSSIHTSRVWNGSQPNNGRSQKVYISGEMHQRVSANVPVSASHCT